MYGRCFEYGVKEQAVKEEHVRYGSLFEYVHSWPLRLLALPLSGPLVLPQRLNVRRLEEQAVNEEHFHYGSSCEHHSDLADGSSFHSRPLRFRARGGLRASVRVCTAGAYRAPMRLVRLQPGRFVRRTGSERVFTAGCTPGTVRVVGVLGPQ